MQPEGKDTKAAISDFAQVVIDEIAKHRGASAQDIDLEYSFTDDMGLNQGEIEDLFRYIAERFDMPFEDLTTKKIRTVSELVEAIEDSSFE